MSDAGNSGGKDTDSVSLTSHDFDHVERVKRMAIFIARMEGVGDKGLEILEKAAELHDIARNKPNHAAEGAKRAREILVSQGCEPEFVERVVECIESHSFSSGKKPESLEACILSDADKLDAMGAIGVARAFLFSKERGRGIEETLKHFEEKLLKLFGMLHTETAKKIGTERHRFLEEFYSRLKNELQLGDLTGV